MTKSNAKVNSSNTKSEIYDAYKELLEKLESNQSETLPLPGENDERNEELIKKTKTYSADKAKNDLIKFKKNFGENLENLSKNLLNELDNVTQKLIEELQKREEVQEAIEIEKKNLEKLYGIKNTAISLSDFLKLKEDEKRKWEEEKKEREKQRRREEEDYQYELTLKRKKEEDEYAEKQRKIKEMFEDDLKSRKVEIQNKEAELEKQLEELNQLREFKDKAESEKEQAVQIALKNQKLDLEKDFQSEREMEIQKHESEINLLKQQLKYTDNLLAQSQKDMTAFKKEADEANAKAQELALKIIEVRKNHDNYYQKEEKNKKDIS